MVVEGLSHTKCDPVTPQIFGGSKPPPYEIGRTMFAPTNKTGNLTIQTEFPQKCNLTNLSICEERTHKGCQGCPLVIVIKLRDQFGHFASFVQA